MKKCTIIAALLGVMLLFSSCNNSVSNQTPAPALPDCTEDTSSYTDISDIKLPPVAPKTDGATFADNLMHMTSGNRMISPYSAKMCLALLANGAKGNTKDEILSAVGISDLDYYNEYVRSTLKRYDSYKGVLTLNTANSLWVNKSIHAHDFLPNYRTAMNDFYFATVHEVTNDNSIEEVNAWAKEKTNGKIDSVLSEEQRYFSLALANAVYFKAAWEIPFEKNATRKSEFTNIDGSVSLIDFMNSTDRYGYYEEDGVKAVSLEYGRIGQNGGEDFYLADKNYSFSMYFMLSENELDVENFLNSNAPFASENVHVSIPKFELEYTLPLNNILMSLGMVDAFGSSADLSGLTGVDGLFVDTVLQKTYIKVDEAGTEAAAVTVIAMKECAVAVPSNPKEFIADKPFYFAIRDNTSGEILFIGRYETAK